MSNKSDKTLLSVKKLPSIEYLREILDYDPYTGEIKWKINKGKAKKGDLIETNHCSGYLCVQIDGQSFLAHRIAWAIYHGKFPSKFIDHIDLVKNNNAIINLREANRENNSQNHNLRSDSTSRVKGVSWHSKLNKWQARIQFNNKRIHIGYFSNLEEAKLAVINFRNKLHKEFANHG